MTIQLSQYQWRILTFAQTYIAKFGMSPSSREIAIGCGINSTSTVNNNLDKLEELGLLTRQRGICRTIVMQGTNVAVAVAP